MTEPIKSKKHPFNASLVHQDLETHRELWDAVLFEHTSSGFLGLPEYAVQQTTYQLMPAQGCDAMLMLLAARWYSDSMQWLDLSASLFQKQVSKSTAQVLVVNWGQ